MGVARQHAYVAGQPVTIAFMLAEPQPLAAVADAARELREDGTYGYFERTREGSALARGAFSDRGRVGRPCGGSQRSDVYGSGQGR